MNYVQMWLFVTNQSEPLRQSSLLMLLAGGVGHGDSLLHGLKAHEAESKGTWGSKVGQLRLLMEQGHSLSSALSMIRDILPDQTISAIRIAEGTGALPDVLMDEARRISKSMQGSRSSGISIESLVLWTFMICTIMSSIVSFLMIFIVPKFKEIFIGFGVEVPALTILLIQISDGLMSYLFLLWMPFTAIVGFGGWWMYSSMRRRMTHGYHRFMEHWPRYWLPGLLRQLSLSAASGSPLGTALDCAMMDMPPGRAARTVSGLRHRVNAGQDTIEALTAVGLVKPREAAFLRSSLQTRHLDWGLRHLADSIERKRGRFLRRIPELLGPVIIVMMGIVVLFVMLGFFMPLIKLINELA
mgnify:CR=1 FL=1